MDLRKKKKKTWQSNGLHHGQMSSQA